MQRVPNFLSPCNLGRYGIHISIAQSTHCIYEVCSILIKGGARSLREIVIIPSLRLSIWLVGKMILKQRDHRLMKCDQDIRTIMNSEIIEPLTHRLEPIHEFPKIHIHVIMSMKVAVDNTEVGSQSWGIKNGTNSVNLTDTCENPDGTFVAPQGARAFRSNVLFFRVTSTFFRKTDKSLSCTPFWSTNAVCAIRM